VSQVFLYPPLSTASSSGNASIGPNGVPIPLDSTLVAGENPSGDLQPLQTNASGSLITTQAAGAFDNVNVAQYGGVATTLGQKVSASSIPIVIASNQTNVPVSSTTLATAANQALTISAGYLPATPSPNSQLVSGVFNPTLPTVPATESVALQLDASGRLIISPTTIPTGAATSALQSSVQGSPTGGTAAIASSLDGGIFNTVLPTLTTGQQAGLQLDASGRLIISPTTAPTGSATAALQSSVQGSVTGGTAGTASELIGGIYNGTLPTLSNGQQSALQTNSNGVLIVQSNLPTGAASATNQALTIGAGSPPGTQAVDSMAIGGVFNTTLPTVGNTQQTTLQVTNTGQLITANRPTTGTLTDASGSTSATPSTSTTATAANTARKYLLFQNVSQTAATIWINFTSAASATVGSYEILAGGSLVQEASYISTEAVTVLSTTASVPYILKTG
jgi:hypothetical protein